MIRTLICIASAAINIPFFATPLNAFACGFCVACAFACILISLERR